MKKFIIVGLWGLACSSDPVRDRPISFSEWRVQQTLHYVSERYGIEQQNLTMLPVMVVSHYTAMDSLDVSYEYMNREEMEDGRGVLKKAGSANIAVHYLVGKAGEIFRLMPENQIGRHVIGLNRHAIGIENVGLDENSLTMAQVDANALIVRRLAAKYPLHYLIGHSEYRSFEKTPLWEEREDAYRTEKHDPGAWFMAALRERVADLALRSSYDRSEIPDRIDYILRTAFATGEFSGTALVIDADRVIFQKAFGNDPESGKPLTPDARLYIASAAKPITALAVARLEAQGKLSYESAVARYFPGLRHLLGNVKIRHLLSHTSGLDDYYRIGKPAPGFTNSDALALIAAQPAPLSAPGKKFHYANSNFVLLAEIIAQVSHGAFQDFITDQVLRPAGMQSTFFVDRQSGTARAAAATDATGGIFRYPYATVGPGGLASTAADLAALDQALMHNRLIAARQFARMVRPLASVEARGEQYAMGFYVVPRRGIVYHDGNFNGYHAVNWINLRKKQAIILLGNRYSWKTRQITAEIDRALNGQEAIVPHK